MTIEISEELARDVESGKRDPAEAVKVLRTLVVYPRFLGVDGSGDLVWELENGRWTWGDDPNEALGRSRTFEPEPYIGRYGVPRPIRCNKAESS